MEPTETWVQKWAKIEPLGGGGQGDTLLVKSLLGEFDRAVLKVLKPQKAQNAKARGRMAQEVTNLKVLRNAGGKVPKVLDDNTEKFEDPSVPLFFVMEYVKGKTLAETVQPIGSLSLNAAVGIALELCSTMQIAIKEGIVHRDIKPENIIIRSLDPADVVIVDFGLSFNEDEDLRLTETEESLDNKFISLPERRGPGENKRDFRSDLTGICAILFYCLTGCAPRNLRDSQGRAPHRWPNYSLSEKVKDELQRDALDLFFSRGLNYEIDYRFQTIDELTTRLKEILMPKAADLIEDFDVVVAREAAALRKNDRKTQLAEYIANVQSLHPPFQLFSNEISKKLSNHRNFSYQYQGIGTRDPPLDTEQGQLIATVTAWVAVRNHQIMFPIHYRFIVQGAECTVYREIREDQTETKIADGPTVVLRYQADTAPNASVLVADFKAAVTKAITLISRKIQSGS